jgi:hypothetical protein
MVMETSISHRHAIKNQILERRISPQNSIVWLEVS